MYFTVFNVFELISYAKKDVLSTAEKFPADFYQNFPSHVVPKQKCFKIKCKVQPDCCRNFLGYVAHKQELCFYSKIQKTVF